MEELIREEIVERFYENNLQKTNQTVFRIEKGIKKKKDKLYVGWKGYDDTFNNLIDKNDINII